MEKATLEIIFLQLGLAEAKYDIDDELKDSNPEFFQYLRDLQSWLYSNFEPPLRTAYDTILAYKQGEELLRIFADKGFILEGNADINGKFIPFLSKVKEMKNFSLIDSDCVPLTKEEMSALTAADFKNDEQSDTPKINWFRIEMPGYGWLGAIFRDNPEMRHSDGFEEIIEFYYIGAPRKPFSELMFEKTMENDEAPIEIRWFDTKGKTHIIWNPSAIYPLSYYPPASNSIY